MPRELRVKGNSNVRWLPLAIIVLSSICACGSPAGAEQRVASAQDARAPITEEGYVPIGGIDQWIQIRGQSGDNPVVLWLNGGPGFSTIPSTPAYARWEEMFTVVMWDQRGEGKTFQRSGRSVAASMTIAQMTSDGIEVAEYLRKRLGKSRIILLGHSWGSMLGVHMVTRRPDLFAAYVGTGQVVHLSANAEAAYPLLLQHAQVIGNKEAEQDLREVGPPPYDDSPMKWVWVSWANRLDPRPQIALQPPARPGLPSPDYVQEGAEFSQGLMWESMMKDDLRALGLKFELPVIFIQGAEDRLTANVLAKQYFDSINAPSKQFVVLPKVGHLAIFRDPDAFLNALTRYARPLALPK